MRPSLVEAWIRLGEVLVELGRAEEGATAFDQALAQSAVELPDVVLSRGYARLKARQPALAEADAERARTARAARAEELLARVALFRNRLDEAEQHAREVVHLRPQPSSTLLLAEILVRRGQLPPAGQAVDDASRRAADLEVPRVPGLEALRAKENPHPQAYVATAAAREAFGRREEAGRWRRRAAEAGRLPSGTSAH